MSASAPTNAHEVLWDQFPAPPEEFSEQARRCARERLSDSLSANPIAVMFAASLRSAPTLKRGRGRPRKKDASFFADVLRGHLGVVAWHQQTYGAPARSDSALYKAFRWHVAETVEADGVAALAARDAALGPRLKTVLNTLAEARAFFKKHPEKHPFTGTDKTAHSESNHYTQESET